VSLWFFEKNYEKRGRYWFKKKNAPPEGPKKIEFPEVLYDRPVRDLKELRPPVD
jgi:hypothetical protein